MATATLLVKARHAWQLRYIDDLLKTQFAELDLELQVLSNPSSRWVQVVVSGEDESIAISFIKKTFGICPATIEDAKASEEVKGYISKVDLSKQELRVDIGIFDPKVIQAVVPLSTLQTALANGINVMLEKLTTLYGLAEGLPLALRINWESSHEEAFSAQLSDSQVTKLQSWRQSLLDRLIILGTSQETIDSVLERTRLSRDVIGVDSLGAFEYALTCKLGTDAAGLVPRMGRYMRNSVFVVFNAENAWTFLVNKD